MIILRCLPLVALFAVASLIALPLHAEPTQAEMDEARAFLKEGREQLDAAHFERAVILLEKAHRIMHVPPTALDLMKAYGAREQLVEAWAIGEEIKNLPRNSTDPQAYNDARREIDEAIGALATRIPTIVLQFKGTLPPSLQVTIDGKPLTGDEIDKPYRVNRGEHTIVCTGEGYAVKTIKQIVESRTDEQYVVTIEMDPLPGPVLPKVAPRPEVPDLSSNIRPNSRRNWIIAGTVVTGGFALASIGLAAGAKSKNDRAVEAAMATGCFDRMDCKRVYDAEYGASTALGISSLVSLGLSVGFGISTLIYVLRGPATADAAAPKVAFDVVATSNGVIVRGVW